MIRTVTLVIGLGLLGVSCQIPVTSPADTTLPSEQPPAATPAPTNPGDETPPQPQSEPKPTEEPEPAIPASLSEVPRISVADVKAKLDAGANIIIVDSRETDEYEVSRIAGAISLPLGEMTAPYNELNGYDEIITYCT